MIFSFMSVFFIVLMNLLFSICCIFDFQRELVAIQTSDWNGIAPLRSTRLDVKNKLGVIPSGKSRDHFKINDYNVYIRYTSHRCDEIVSGGWDVPIGTVFLIDILPKKRVSMSSIKIDLNQFKVTEVKDVAGVKIYSSTKLGFEIECYEKTRTIARISYFPSDKYKHLQCP